MSSVSTLLISMAQVYGWNIHLMGFLGWPNTSFVAASASAVSHPWLLAIATLGKCSSLHAHSSPLYPKPITLTFVKIKYKMETRLARSLSTQTHLHHISKTKSSLVHEHKPNLASVLYMLQKSLKETSHICTNGVR